MIRTWFGKLVIRKPLAVNGTMAVTLAATLLLSVAALVAVSRRDGVRSRHNSTIPWQPAVLDAGFRGADRDGVLSPSVNRFLAAEPRDFVDLLHRWRVLAVLPGKTGATPDAALPEGMEVLFATRELQRRFPESPPVIYPTPFGWEVRLHSSDARTEHWQAQYHIDQALAVCAEVGVRIDHPIEIEGSTITVRDLLSTSRLSFVRDQEWEWSMLAYLSYLPDEPEWDNRFGEHWTYHEIVGELLERDMDAGSCAGAHKQYLLAFLLRLDEERPILDGRQRNDVQDFLARCSRALMQSQLANGAWHIDWARPRSLDNARGLLIGAVDDLVFITGHQLEWICICPEDLRPDRVSVAAASEFLARALAHRDPREILANYCGFSHGARAIVLADVPSGDSFASTHRKHASSEHR